MTRNLAPSVTPKTPQPASSTTFAFIVSGDPQLLNDPILPRASSQEQAVPEVVAQINTLARGTITYPDTTTVSDVRGVIVAGDLTTSGSSYQSRVYKRALEKALAIPIYDGLGNHDFDESQDNLTGSPVLSYLTGQLEAACHAPSDSLEAASTSKTIDCDGTDSGSQVRTGLFMRHTTHSHYAWKWNDLNFVMLNEHAGGKPSGSEPAVPGPREDEAMNSLHFLASALDEHKGETFVLAQHYGFDTISMATTTKLMPCTTEDTGWMSPVTIDSVFEVGTSLQRDDGSPDPLRLDPPFTSWGPDNGDTVRLTGTTVTDGNLCLNWTIGSDPQFLPCTDATTVWTPYTNQDGGTGISTPGIQGPMCLYAKNRWWGATEREAMSDMIQAANADHGTQVVSMFHGHSHLRQSNLWDLNNHSAAPMSAGPLPYDPGALPSFEAGQMGGANGFFVVRITADDAGSTMDIFRRVPVPCSTPTDGGCWEWSGTTPSASLSW